ncbi:response regulator [Ectothiorhodospiraceae bacterium BW-2]|nr:response regulator [Ectothiorhodospiraceae bacterium BW-2]
MSTEPLQATILIVDDTPENIDILVELLAPNYRTRVALNGERALQLAQREPYPDLILLDVMMPGMSGYEVCEQLKQLPRLAAVPVIFITAMSETEDEQHGLDLGAVDYITKPIRPAIVKSRIATHLQLYQHQKVLEETVCRRTAALRRTRLQVIRRLGRAAEFRDNETGNHVVRMSHYSRLIASAYGLDERQIERLFQVAPMHDVGKIGVSDHILLKPSKLSPEEWREMQRHCDIGAEIIGNHQDELLSAARLVALTHHEKWNGSGYPQGLRGEEIPLFGRIVALADVFDALTSARPYKAAWPVERAVELINAEAGEHFDPALIAPFHQVLPQILQVKERYAEGREHLSDTDLTADGRTAI